MAKTPGTIHRAAGRRGAGGAPSTPFLLKGWVLVALCYALALLLYLGLATFALVRDNLRRTNGTMAETALRIEEVLGDGVILLEPEKDGRERFVSNSHDPQLLIQGANGAPFYAGVVEFSAEAHRPSGEMVLYYATKADAEGSPVFSERNKLWASLTPEGTWRFDMKGKQVLALRLDPDSVEEGVLWTVNYLTLNADKPALQYYLPDARAALLLLALPGLAAAMLLETGSVLLWLYGRRRGKPAGR